MAVHGGAGDRGALGWDSPGETAAGRGISGGGGVDIPAPGNGIFFAVAGLGKNQRFTLARVELSATGFLPVAEEFGVEMRASRLVS